jgi:hypothetical protein
METLEISKKGPKCHSAYDNIINYIGIIESTNTILKLEGPNHIYCNTIQTSCKKIKDIIEHDITEKPLRQQYQIFNPLSKIDKIINNFAVEINQKNIDINIINEMGNNIIINNNEILIDRLLVNILKTIITDAPESSQIHISLSHNYPYLMIKFSLDNFVVYFNEELIKDVMCKVEGEFNKDIINDNLNIVFNIPLHSKLGGDVF